MTDTKKPFACPSPGCNMSFTNDDHLTVHKKKHDMILNLETNNKNNVFVDQTPTPTRFIKNCEELGLFQDLQNDNPFEETFRRAVEGVKIGASTAPDTDISDDTLHTPHIFPHITDCQTANGQIIHVTSAIDELSSVQPATVIDVTKNALLDSTRAHNLNENVFRHGNKFNDALLNDEKSKSDDQLLKKRKIKNRLLSINGEDVQLLLKTADGKLMQLTAIPVSENVESRACTATSDQEDVTTAPPSNEKLSTVVIKTNPPLKCSKKSNPSRLSLAKLKLKQVLTKGSDTDVDQSERIVTENDKEEDAGAMLSKENVNKKRTGSEQNKKQEKRERNRASSMRCRAKRKEWIHQLQRTISCANEKNAALQLEIKNLHTEIARLKTLLMAHKDCPITRAIEKGNLVIDSKLVNTNTEVVQLASDFVMNSQAASFSPVTKKLCLISTSKNPIILKKPEIQPVHIQPAVVNSKINPFVTFVVPDNYSNKHVKSKPCNISNIPIIVNSSVNVVNKNVISSQLSKITNLNENKET